MIAALKKGLGRRNRAVFCALMLVALATMREEGRPYGSELPIVGEPSAPTVGCVPRPTSSDDPVRSISVYWSTSTSAGATAEIQRSGGGGVDIRRIQSTVRRSGREYVHLAVFTRLTPNTKYQVRCSNEQTGFGEWVDFGTASEDIAFPPSTIPDRVILTWSGDPATSVAVTWRTDTTIDRAVTEIAEASDSPLWRRDHAEPYTHPLAQRVENGTTTRHVDEHTGMQAHYHSMNLSGLRPDTVYAYRVGDGVRWSEWFHFRTATHGLSPFSFLYFGDVQNGIRTMVSRVKRQALMNHPGIRFKVYAGDLVATPNDIEWGEWFQTDGWHNAMVPTLPAAGNHEYALDPLSLRPSQLTSYWRTLFALPEHGPEGQKEAAYYLDYQGTRFVVLTSTELLFKPDTRERQLGWLRGVLRENPNRWTCLILHHPIWSEEPWRSDVPPGPDGRRPSEGYLAKTLKPIIDRYRVDLVLQGHLHSYSRGQRIRTKSHRLDEATHTMYMTSSSTAAVISLKSAEDEWMDRVGEDLQLYQVISVNGNKISVDTYTATGRLYDAFDLVKTPSEGNRVVNRVPADVPPHRRTR